MCLCVKYVSILFQIDIFILSYKQSGEVVKIMLPCWEAVGF